MPTLTVLLLVPPALLAMAWVAYRFLFRRKGTRAQDEIFIRPQRAGEVEALAGLIETAFRTARVSDGREQDFFRDTLMAEDRFLPGLSLVAERAGEPVGHVMLTRLWAEGLLLLAPLSVRTDLRGHGVGARLMRAVLRKAQAEGWCGVVLVGGPGILRTLRLSADGIPWAHARAAVPRALSSGIGALSGGLGPPPRRKGAPPLTALGQRAARARSDSRLRMAPSAASMTYSCS